MHGCIIVFLVIIVIGILVELWPIALVLLLIFVIYKIVIGQKPTVGNDNIHNDKDVNYDNLGGLLLGPAGALVGTATGIKGKNGKTKFICQKCGKIFEVKV